MWLDKSHLTDEHLFRTDDVYARSARRLAELSWSEENLRAVVETPQNPNSTTVDIPPAAELSLLLLQHQKYLEMRRREPTAKPEDDEEMQGAVGHKNDTTSFKIKQR